MAEFLLAIFIVLSLGIFQILILSAVTNYKIKDNLMKYMLFTLVILLAIAAYMFDFQANSNNDLKRFVQEFEAIKNNRADLFQIMSKNHPFEFLYYIIAFLMSFVTDYHWFPVLCVLFEYSVFVYILSRESKHFDNQALGIIICIIYKIALIPPYMSISASRNTIAYALFSLGIYRLFKEDGNDIKKAGIYLNADRRWSDTYKCILKRDCLVAGFFDTQQTKAASSDIAMGRIIFNSNRILFRNGR